MDIEKLGSVAFLDLCKILDRKGVSVQSTKKTKLQTITKPEMIELITKNFNTLSALQQQNIITYFKNYQ